MIIGIYSLELSALLSYAIAISITSFCTAAFDKFIAGSKATRVPEAVLYLLALAGGSPGLLLCMNLLRHKTKKHSFQLVLAGVLAIQLAVARWILA